MFYPTTESARPSYFSPSDETDIRYIWLVGTHIASSYASLLRGNVQIPIDLSIISISVLQPFVSGLEMPASKLFSRVSNAFRSQTRQPCSTYETARSTQRTRMNTLQNMMLLLINTITAFLSRVSPCKEHYASCSSFRNDIDHFPRELFPSFICMTIGLMSCHRQAGI